MHPKILFNERRNKLSGQLGVGGREPQDLIAHLIHRDVASVFAEELLQVAMKRGVGNQSFVVEVLHSAQPNGYRSRVSHLAAEFFAPSLRALPASMQVNSQRQPQ
jgi:hypothetical protein